jgi:hypothetical protein
LAEIRGAIDRVLKALEPWPALAVDRHWSMVAENASVPALLSGLPPSLLVPPINVLRASLHPDGLARQIVNLGEWRRHLLRRLERQVEESADPVLAELLDELRALPAPSARSGASAPVQGDEVAGSSVVVPLVLDTPLGRLSFVSTTTVFGAPNDVTLSEFAIETLLPADAATQAALLRLLP